MHQKVAKSSSDSFAPNYNNAYHPAMPIASITARSIPAQVRADLKWVLHKFESLQRSENVFLGNLSPTMKNRLFAKASEKEVQTFSLASPATASPSSKTLRSSARTLELRFPSECTEENRQAHRGHPTHPTATFINVTRIPKSFRHQIYLIYLFSCLLIFVPFFLLFVVM